MATKRKLFQREVLSDEGFERRIYLALLFTTGWTIIQFLTFMFLRDFAGLEGHLSPSALTTVATVK